MFVVYTTWGLLQNRRQYVRRTYDFNSDEECQGTIMELLVMFVREGLLYYLFLLVAPVVALVRIHLLVTPAKGSHLTSIAWLCSAHRQPW